MPSAEHAKINKTSILHAEGMWSSWRVHTTYKPIIIRQCDMNQEKKKTMSSTGEAQPEPGKFTEAMLLLEA